MLLDTVKAVHFYSFKDRYDRLFWLFPEEFHLNLVLFCLILEKINLELKNWSNWLTSNGGLFKYPPTQLMPELLSLDKSQQGIWYLSWSMMEVQEAQGILRFHSPRSLSGVSSGHLRALSLLSSSWQLVPEENGSQERGGRWCTSSHHILVLSLHVVFQSISLP